MANSGSGSGVNSPSCYTTTTIKCNGTNLIDWLLSKSNKIYGKGNDKQLPQDFLDRTLDKGIVTTMCDVCCPCPGAGYVLSSVETYLKYAEAVFNTQQILPPGGTCCSSFQDSVNNIFDDCFQVPSIGACADRILDKGIVEQGLIDGQSQLQSLLDWIVSIMPLVGNTTACEILDRILDKGIVIFCEPDTDRVIIASVETFLKWNEAVAPEMEPSCCTNVFASTETYLKYAEIKGLTPA